jgi:hypothetical protein
VTVLVACEFSGIVRDAFRARGYDAISCDLLPSEREGPHIQGDVLEILTEGWDLMVAHPPCTYLSYVGNRHWNNPGRAEKRTEAMRFFMALYNAPIPRIAIENPYEEPCRVFRKPDQIIHPYYFGDTRMKKTCLWLRGLRPLAYLAGDKPKPMYYLRTTGKAIHWTEGMHGSHERSRFSPFIADAMAEQWGTFEEKREAVQLTLGEGNR